MRATLISVKDCLRKELSKAGRPQMNDKLNKLIDCSTLLNKDEHFNNLEMEGEDIIPKAVHTKTDQPGEIKQSSSSQKYR